ncbi:hypothetical protein ACOSQ4_013416 [Xanthoceras sorbifolium]
MVLCIAIAAGFKNQYQNGNASGIADIMVMLLTTFLMVLVMLIVCRMSVWHYGTVKHHQFELHSKVSIAWILGLCPSLRLVRVPGVGLVYTKLPSGDDCDLQEVLKICIDKGIHTIRINVDLLPVQLLPQAEVHLTQPPAESSSSSINGTPLPNCSDELIFIFSEVEDGDSVTQNDYDAEISCEDEDYNPCEDDSESSDENDSVESL